WECVRCAQCRAGWGELASCVRLVDGFPDCLPPCQRRCRAGERAGCDTLPIDPGTPEGQLTLLTYVWPDQRERIALLRGALEVARRVPAAIDAAGAPAWLATRLAAPAAGVASVVFHSIVMQYLSAADRRSVASLLAQAGRRATAAAPPAWLRMEPGGGQAEVHLTLWPARRVPDHGIAHDQDAPPRAVERDLARRLPGHAEHGEGADPLAGREGGVDGRALAPRVGRVGSMDRDRGAGPLPHQRGLAHVVAVGDDDARHAVAHQAGEHVRRGLDRIDAQVSLGVADEIAVEVVPVGLGEPGPGEDPIHDLAHATPPTRSYAGAPPRVNPTPRLYTRTFWIACAIHFTGGMSMGMFLLLPLF